MTTAPTADPTEASARSLRVRTRLVPTAGALLDLLPTPTGTLAWVSGGDGLVGWGEAARFSPCGPDRFALAERWWREFVAGLEVHDEVGLPGTGPVALVSMAFADDPGTSVLVVPRVLVGRRDGVTWVTEFTGDDTDSGLAVSVQPVSAPGVVRYSEGQLPVTGYREAVRAAVARMRAGELGKVVLAHDLIASAQQPFDPRFLLRGLAGRYPDCWVFAVDGLVGATPELLLRREGSALRSRILAGTSWPRPGLSEDELAEELRGSAKNREEHGYAVRSLVDQLAPLCSTLTVPEPEVLRLHNVLHLATTVTGQLAGAESSLLRLAEALHPTAAVGGTPRADAVRVIEEIERMDRGRYAAPVGWIDGNGEGELGVALRCAQVDGATARLFAGCGLVADSDPDTEVAEAAAKLVPVRDALEGA